MTNTVFGIAGLGAITGHTYIDESGSAVFDISDDRPLSNRDISILWAGIDGQLGLDDDVQILASTNQFGVYRLENAPVGSYRVVGTFESPNGTPLPRRQDVTIAREQIVQVDIPIGALKLRKPVILPKGSRLGVPESAAAIPDENGKVLALPGTGTSVIGRMHYLMRGF